ncbi:hypothetical protein D3C73_1617610 [compost metagenome]
MIHPFIRGNVIQHGIVEDEAAGETDPSNRENDEERQPPHGQRHASASDHTE